MRKTRTEVVDVDVSIVCDCCAREDDAQGIEAGEYLQINFIGGYGSVFGDGTKVTADLCQDCLKSRLGDILKIKESEF